jgi:dipeptidyl aminopeptidase/acylaminoacyl peptidase
VKGLGPIVSPTICLVVAVSLFAQQRPEEAIVKQIEHGGCAELEVAEAKVCGYDYSVDGHRVEALLFRPVSTTPAPGILLIPGYQRTAQDLIPMGKELAEAGFASIAISQPGFGESEGPADFVGPKTLEVLTAGYRKLQNEPFVNPKRMGIYGYSRGGMAASLLAVQIDDVKAAVFGAGVYDFKRAYDESTLPGVRNNMKMETGMTPEAIRERSSILRMDLLKCPVLILHGGKDKNVPVSQALLLRDRLTALHKEFEIKLFPDREHAIGPQVIPITIDFFQRKLR